MYTGREMIIIQKYSEGNFIRVTEEIQKIFLKRIALVIKVCFNLHNVKRSLQLTNQYCRKIKTDFCSVVFRKESMDRQYIGC